jgi:hypothetical protein
MAAKVTKDIGKLPQVMVTDYIPELNTVTVCVHAHYRNPPTDAGEDYYVSSRTGTPCLRNG